MTGAIADPEVTPTGAIDWSHPKLRPAGARTPTGPPRLRWRHDMAQCSDRVGPVEDRPLFDLPTAPRYADFTR